MKLAFLHFWTLRLPRGVETLTLSLANALAEHGEQVQILCARRTREPLVVPSPQVRVREFPTFRYSEAATIVPFYLTALARERFDAVITFFADFGEGPALAWTDRFHRSKLILYLTFPLEAAPHRYTAYKQYGWERRADVLLADASYTAAHGQAFFGRSVVTLPSGTDPGRFRPNAKKRMATRRNLGLRDEDVVLLNVSALEERKGTWRVVEALPEIRARCPNVRYLVLGEGPQKTILQQRVAELGLESCVIFAGTTADLPPFYNAADVFVMLSDSEAGSVACLEAMASGLPAVVSNTGGFSEVVNNASGRIVDLKDWKQIADAIVELAGDGALRAQLGMSGRTTVIEKFSWERLAERLQFICKQAVKD